MRTAILECEQRSDEWFAARAGVPSASGASNFITPTGKFSESQGMKSYIYQLIAERVGYSKPTFTSQAMDDGIDREQTSIDWLAFEEGIEFEQIGTLQVFDGDNLIFNASPDAVAKDCGAEVKNPEVHTQIARIDAGELPREYKAQVHANLWAFNLHNPKIKHWWFVSYCEHEGVRPFKCRVEFDDYTEKVGEAIMKFNERLNETAAKVLGVTA